jgi:hypothetical protein
VECSSSTYSKLGLGKQWSAVVVPTASSASVSSGVPVLIHSHTHKLIHSYTHTLIHSYTHTLIHSYTHTLIHSYTHTLIHSYTHTLKHALGLLYDYLRHDSTVLGLDPTDSSTEISTDAAGTSSKNPTVIFSTVILPTVPLHHPLFESEGPNTPYKVAVLILLLYTVLYTVPTTRRTR